MAEAEEKKNSNHFTKQMNGKPRDLFQRFIPGDHFPRKFKETPDDEEEGIELSLGLSLNGRFGVDPKRAKELTRSSSISDFMLTNDDDNNKAAFVAPPTAYAPLIRTCSLPAETGEQWRKRKEIQSLRRLEAKRKRLEKLKNVRTVSAEGSESKGERGGGMEGLPPQRPSTQGSIGSQGSGSSGISESESQPTHGMNRCTEARSPASVQLQQPKQNEQKPVITLGTTEKSVKLVGNVTMENPSVKVTANNNEGKEIMRNVMADMPYVSTRGVGPNGKRIEGFLFKYGKGEEVRIVCVCHGSSLSPADFVKHAGGGDVAHPLKHIVVNPSSLL